MSRADLLNLYRNKRTNLPPQFNTPEPQRTDMMMFENGKWGEKGWKDINRTKWSKSYYFVWWSNKYLKLTSKLFFCILRARILMYHWNVYYILYYMLTYWPDVTSHFIECRRYHDKVFEYNKWHGMVDWLAHWLTISVRARRKVIIIIAEFVLGSN